MSREWAHLVVYYGEILTFFFFLWAYLEVRKGCQSLKGLRSITPLRETKPEKVSVVVAARNEERHLEEAFGSLLKQTYDPLEIIIVNDRSTDGTADILARLAKGQKNVKVEEVAHLPKHWLGKTHALHVGAERATGEYLLFTDADVVMEPAAISRAMHYVKGHELDHLAIEPEIKTPHLLLDFFMSGFLTFMYAFSWPWRAKDPKSRRSVGVGAFNLLRREAYDKMGKHKALAMRPDDDLKLGRLVKQAGLKQDFLCADGMVWVEWYSTFGECTEGLMKGSFASANYHVGTVICYTIAMLWFFIFPFAGLVLTNGLNPIVNLLNIGLLGLSYLEVVRHTRYPWWYFPTLPVSAAFLIFIQWKAMLTTLRKKGIVWRGTHYDLEELRGNRI